MNMRLGILLSLLVVTGCANIAKWVPSDFDNVEFDRLAELHILASEPLDGKNWCGSYDIGMMHYNARVLSVYSEYRLNQNITDVYTAIQDLTQELKDRENPSEGYCKIKRQGIANISKQALETFGDRK
jgi:hypothetical protein